MHFDLSKPQKLLQESARTFFKRECPLTRVRELMETGNGFDETLWTHMVDQGWTGLMLPEKYEGLELSIVELAALAEEMGRACTPSPFLATTWASVLIAESENTPIQTKYLKAIAEGSCMATVALQDAESGWNPNLVATTLQPTDDGFKLTGEKWYVLDAATADVLLVVAKKRDQLAIALIPRNREGISIESTPSIDETRKFSQVKFNEVTVSSEDLIAVGGQADKALQRSMHVGTIAVCADLIGLMQWMLETTVEYAKTRKQFGVPIGSFQAVQHQCADMLLLLESSRSATYYAAWALSEDDPASERAVSMAKAYCSDSGREIGNRACQVLGGIGFTWEHDLQLYYKRAKGDELLFGDATFHREELAKLILND